jgi:hypothetical protein
VERAGLEPATLMKFKSKVNIKWDKRAVQKVQDNAMQTIESRAKAKLSTMQCETHGETPSLVAGAGAAGRFTPAAPQPAARPHSPR